MGWEDLCCFEGKQELQKNKTEYGAKLRFLHELGEGLLQEDADILKRSPASTKAEPSEPAYRVDDFGMVYGDTRAFQTLGARYK